MYRKQVFCAQNYVQGEKEENNSQNKPAEFGGTSRRQQAGLSYGQSAKIAPAIEVSAGRSLAACTAIVLILVGSLGLAGCVGLVAGKNSAIPQQPQTPPPAALQIVTTSLPGAAMSQSYQATLAATGGVTPYIWSVATNQLPSGLALNPQTGAIAGTATTSGTFQLTIGLKDSSPTPQTVSATLSLQVSGPTVQPLKITVSSLPNAIDTQAYSTQLTCSGGTAPWHWSLQSGQLPSGVSLNASSGMISGTPNQNGSFPLTVQVQDSESTPQTATASLSLQVTGSSVQPLQITVSSLPNATDTQAYSTQLTSSGGTAPMHWSLQSGQLPSGISLNASSGVISGTPTQSGSFPLTVQVQDSESTPQTATKSLSLTAAAAPPPPPATPAFYGSGLRADALSNQELVQIGGQNYLAAYRFRATHTGSVQGLHFYLIVNKPGYSGGNGGEVRADLETDDGSAAHDPSGTVLATYTITNPQAGLSGPDSGPYGYFPTITFASSAAVTQGQLYHVVFSNPSADPAVNFVSLDSLWMDVASTPVQPTLSDTDFAVLRQVSGSSWTQSNTLTPIFQVDYADGTTAGNGYMEAWVGASEPINGTAAVRETFTNNSGANLAVTSVSVRVNRSAGTAPLTVRLEQNDGTLIEQGSVASSSVPIAADPTWVTYTFSAVRTLFAGQGYNLVLVGTSGTTYTAYPIRKGSGYGFASNTFFNDGYAQFNPGSGWVGWTQWGVPNRTDGDLQFYFTTTP